MARKKIKNNTDQRPFSMIYHDFFKSNLLNTYEKMVYIALKIFSDNHNQCFPSLKKLSDITGISKRKVQDALKEMEQKHIIGIENRLGTNGGKSSNLYTLYDYAEIWNVDSGSCKEQTATVAKEIAEMKLIAELQSRGYTVTKEKEPGTTKPTRAVAPSTQKNDFDVNNNSIKETKSQVERYTMEDIKALYEYDILIIQYPEKQMDIDIVFDILYDTLNSTKKTIKIGGEDKLRMMVIGKLMKLHPDDLIYSIDKYHEQTDRIKNVKGYLLTVLYNSREQQHLDIMNLGHHNGDF